MRNTLFGAMFGIALSASFSTLAYAAEHEVLMLNTNASGIMAFEPALLNVAVGDTVKFIPKDMGHNAESIEGLMPVGAASFKGDISAEIIIKIEKEGVYVVQCNPHSMMAMVSVIVAGKATNLAQIKEQAENYSTKFVMNKTRLQEILAKIN
ncbi:MAG: pseudoazurin [Oceanospirillaceae bacterium]|nr:pseudoazurin [Oceanospirillaceae bacterium]